MPVDTCPRSARTRLVFHLGLRYLIIGGTFLFMERKVSTGQTSIGSKHCNARVNPEATHIYNITSKPRIPALNDVVRNDTTCITLDVGP